jgi:hypothetical protein
MKGAGSQETEVTNILISTHILTFIAHHLRAIQEEGARPRLFKRGKTFLWERSNAFHLN